MKALTLTVTALASVLIFVSGRAAADEPDWQTKFDEIYRLSDKEKVKFIPAPFDSARTSYHQKQHVGVRNIPGQYGFSYDGKRVEQIRWCSDPGAVASAMEIAGVQRVDLEGTPELLDLKVAGDWIVRKRAPRKEVVADMARILEKLSEGKVHIQPAEVEKDVLVARGRFKFKKLTDPPAPREPDNVHLYVGKMDTQEGAGGGTGTMRKFLDRVGELCETKVIDETEPLKEEVSWTNNYSASDTARAPRAASNGKHEQLLKNVSVQTGLEFRTERRKVLVYKVTDPTGKSGGL